VQVTVTLGNASSHQCFLFRANTARVTALTSFELLCQAGPISICSFFEVERME
jgi:hypothetical protein